MLYTDCYTAGVCRRSFSLPCTHRAREIELWSPVDLTPRVWQPRRREIASRINAYLEDLWPLRARAIQYNSVLLWSMGV